MHVYAPLNQSLNQKKTVPRERDGLLVSTPSVRLTQLPFIYYSLRQCVLITPSVSVCRPFI